jgi:MFS family permease
MARLEQRCRQAGRVELPEPDHGLHPVVVTERGAWSEMFANPQYRGRTLVLIACWLLGYVGLIYGAGSFTAVYMVEHGASAHFVFLTFAVTGAVVFLAFQANSRLGDRVERRDVICAMAGLFAASWVVIYLVPSLPVIAAFFVLSRIGGGLWLFNLYNYTAAAYPTRIRATAFAWTDGLGHLGAWAGVTLLGPLYVLGPNHLGWILWIMIPGALLPAMLIRTLGIKQAGIVLEQVST